MDGNSVSCAAMQLAYASLSISAKRWPRGENVSQSSCRWAIAEDTLSHSHEDFTVRDWCFLVYQSQLFLRSKTTQHFPSRVRRSCNYFPQVITLTRELLNSFNCWLGFSSTGQWMLTEWLQPVLTPLPCRSRAFSIRGTTWREMRQIRRGTICKKSEEDWDRWTTAEKTHWLSHITWQRRLDKEQI